MVRSRGACFRVCVCMKSRLEYHDMSHCGPLLSKRAAQVANEMAQWLAAKVGEPPQLPGESHSLSQPSLSGCWLSCRAMLSNVLLSLTATSCRATPSGFL